MNENIKVKCVKTYTNHIGRQFRRYAIVGKPEVLPFVFDVCVRESRNACQSLSSAEAKVVAIEKLSAVS